MASCKGFVLSRLLSKYLLSFRNVWRLDQLLKSLGIFSWQTIFFLTDVVAECFLLTSSSSSSSSSSPRNCDFKYFPVYILLSNFISQTRDNRNKCWRLITFIQSLYFQHLKDLKHEWIVFSSYNSKIIVTRSRCFVFTDVERY